MQPVPLPVLAKMASSATPCGPTFQRAHMALIASASTGTVQPMPSLSQSQQRLIAGMAMDAMLPR
jgi:hypothetical protein